MVSHVCQIEVIVCKIFLQLTPPCLSSVTVVASEPAVRDPRIMPDQQVFILDSPTPAQEFVSTDNTFSTDIITDNSFQTDNTFITDNSFVADNGFVPENTFIIADSDESIENLFTDDSLITDPSFITDNSLAEEPFTFIAPETIAPVEVIAEFHSQ